MLGLIRKDFYNTRRQIILYGVMAVLYLFFAAVQKNSSIFIGIVMMASAMLPVTALAYDERAGWDRYAAAMPLKRRDLVLEKYLMGGILLLAVVAVSLAACVLVSGGIQEEDAFSVLFLGTFYLVYLSVLLPVVFRIGTERARYVMMLLFILPFAGIIAADQMTKHGIGIFSGWQAKAELGVEMLKTAGIISLLAAVLAFVVSGRISVAIYEKKEL